MFNSFGAITVSSTASALLPISFCITLHNKKWVTYKKMEHPLNLSAVKYSWPTLFQLQSVTEIRCMGKKRSKTCFTVMSYYIAYLHIQSHCNRYGTIKSIRTTLKVTQACSQQPGQWCHLVAAPSTHSSLNIKRTHSFINREPCFFFFFITLFCQSCSAL